MEAPRAENIANNSSDGRGGGRGGRGGGGRSSGVGGRGRGGGRHHHHGRGRGGRGSSGRDGGVGGGGGNDDGVGRAAGGAGAGDDGAGRMTATTSSGGGGGGGAGASNDREGIHSVSSNHQQRQQHTGQQDRPARGERGRGHGGRGRTQQHHKQQQQHLQDDAGRGEQDVNNGRGRKSRGGGGSGRGRGRGRGGRGGRASSPAGAGIGGRPQDEGNDDAIHDSSLSNVFAAPVSVMPESAIPSSGFMVTATTSQQIQHQYSMMSLSSSGQVGSASIAADNIAFSSSMTTTKTTAVTSSLSNHNLFSNTNSNDNNTTTVLSGGGGVLPSHPPIFMSRLNTHLSLDNLTDEEEVAAAVVAEHHHHHHHLTEEEEEEDHIARQLAKGLLLDDMDHPHHDHRDGECDDNAAAGMNALAVAENSNITQPYVAANFTTSNASSTNNNNISNKDITGTKRAKLVQLPVGYSLDEGGNVLPVDDESKKKKGKKKTALKKTRGKKSANGDSNSDSATTPSATTTEAAADEDTTTISASDAIKNLNVKEVSIGESTTVQMKQKSIRRDSSKTYDDDSTSAAAAPVINLLANRRNSSTKVTGTEKKAKSSSSSSTKGKKLSANKEKGSGGGDEAANNLRAARQFNRHVRSCVERSDPDGMREILRNKHNHMFALDAHVLETVMKAYVMAAMFEDALYCLRNCTLPGTLSTVQTERILQCLPQNLRNSSEYTAADMIDALCIATKFDVPTTRTYFMRIVRGISLEFLQEATSARDRICSAPCERLVRSAHCVVDARLRRGKKPCDLIVDPGYQLGIFIPDTQENRGMQAGDAVSILPYAGPYPMSAESLDRNMIEATVTNAMPLVLRLQDKGNADLYQMLIDTSEGNVYRIDKLANRMGFTRQLSAVISVVSPIEYDEDGCYVMSDRRHPSPELIKAITAMDANIDQVMMAGGNFRPQGGGGSGILTSTANICSQAVSWRDSSDYNGSKCDDADDSYSQEVLRTESLLALEKYGALEGLNASQRLAVQGAASNRLTLVQGPPGTGMLNMNVLFE
jgi:hypothetical protein